MILVTGATGMNGSAVIRELGRRKVQVRALVRDRAKGVALGRSPSVEIIEGDMLRPETLGRALDGVTLADRRRALLAAGATPYFVYAVDEQTSERRRCPRSAVDLTTHRTFGVRPTTFAEFALRHADAFRGVPASRPA